MGVLAIETHAGNLALGALCLLALLPFAVAYRRGLPTLGLGVCVGLVASIATVNIISAAFDFERTANHARVLKHVVEATDLSRPQLMLVGSSITLVSVDPELMERLLNSEGRRRNLQVLNLTGPGVYMYAQDYYLDRYFERSGKVPDWVFIEIGAEFFANPADVPSDRVLFAETILVLSPTHALWRLRYVFANRSLSLVTKLQQSWGIVAHALYHVTNYGLRAQGLRYRDIGISPGFSPLADDDPKRGRLDPAYVAQSLSTQPGPEHVPPTPLSAQWREWQARKLLSRGAKVVGFYQSPNIFVEARAWMRQVCLSLPKDIRCIYGDDAELQQLDASKWYDQAHLTKSGAPIFTRWLARRIGEAASGN